jgi:uncharacterized membrane protein YgcG
MRLRTLSLGLLLLIALPAIVVAQERILEFVSDVKVERNGDLVVAETIRVQAEGAQIRRGILRDFPTTYRRPDGSRVVVGFEVRSVTRDGAAENFVTERLDNGVRIRIGSADRIIPRGPHTYVITYRTTRQIGFFPSYDELYWNVTGTGWTFAIDMAEARITLPEKVPFRQTAFYTGPQDARGQDARVVEQRSGYIVFRTTQPLPVRNGLTIAAAWDKGVVNPPTAAEQAEWLMADNLPHVVGVGGLLALLAYYAFAWVSVGRDPPRGTIIPLFAPPAGMSAAGVRYVRDMQADNRCFAAAIVELGVNGYLRLKGTGTDTVVERLPGSRPIGAAERSAYSTLLGSRPSLKLEQTNHQIISAAISTLKEGLVEAYYGKLFHNNSLWSIVGLMGTIALAVAVALSMLAIHGPDLGPFMVVGMIFTMVSASVGAGLVTSLLSGSRFGLGTVIGGISAIGLAALGAFMLAMASSHWFDALVLVPMLIAAAVATLAFFILKAPTREGRKVMDDIEGFRQYLGVAEEERLQFLHPPEKTPELFEKFLPYAIALDVENAWAARFASVLAAAAAAGAASTWYSGGYYARDPVAFAEHLSRDLSYTIASASTAPGSSGGGSGGGGSSGGGGGGGGGSGW